MEHLEVFRLFDEVSEWCWNAVERWQPRAQRTVGEQLIRAADSVCANLIEGDGRYAPKDSVHFFIIARGSARETRMWLTKAVRRGLIPEDEGAIQIERLTTATRLLNNLNRYRKQKGSFEVVRELVNGYNLDPLVEEL